MRPYFHRDQIFIPLKISYLQKSLNEISFAYDNCVKISFHLSEIDIFFVLMSFKLIHDKEVYISRIAI